MDPAYRLSQSPRLHIGLPIRHQHHIHHRVVPAAHHEGMQSRLRWVGFLGNRLVGTQGICAPAVGATYLFLSFPLVEPRRLDDTPVRTRTDQRFRHLCRQVILVGFCEDLLWSFFPTTIQAGFQGCFPERLPVGVFLMRMCLSLSPPILLEGAPVRVQCFSSFFPARRVFFFRDVLTCFARIVLHFEM